jgi:uncharacterized protein DUF669
MSTSTHLDTAFEPEKEEGTPPRELLPEGKYYAEIVNAVVGPTKNGKGQAVNLTWTITEGEYEKRLVFQNILIQHESEEAQRFGRRKLKDICVCIGITDPITDLSVLLYKPVIIHVIIRHDKEGRYDDKNEVSRVSPVVASWSGLREKLKEATTTPKGFEPAHEDLNEELPF